MVDCTEASIGTGGQSGPGNFVIDNITIGPQLNLGADATADYGGIAEGSAITIEFTGGTCSRYPTAIVTGVNGCVPGGCAIASVALQDPGSCTGATPPVAHAYVPTNGGTMSGTAWNNNTGFPTGANNSATFHVPCCPVTGPITITNGGSSYPLDFVGGLRTISNQTLAGTASTVNRINGGLVVDGNFNVNVNAIHCEKMVATGGATGTGDCVQAGTFGFQPSGTFANINSGLDVSGANLHFGQGIDNGQTVTSNSAQTFTLIQDDKNATTLTSTSCNLGSGFAYGIGMYLPGNIVSGCTPGQGPQILGSLNGSQTLPSLTVSPTWSTTGLVDAALLINPTNTGSGAGSLLIDAQLGGSSQFKVDKAGNAMATTSTSAPVYTAPSGLTFKPGVDSSTAYKIQNQAGTTNAVIVDTSGNLVGFWGNALQVGNGGTITKYSGIQTAGLGVAADLGAVDKTGLAANLAPTTLLASGAAPDGTYRVSVYLAITTVATSSTMPTSCVTWTDRDNGQSQSLNLTASATTNSLTTVAQATAFIDAKVSTSNIQIATGLANCGSGANYASSPALVMQYKVRAKIEGM
jgi:hypothetical protein